MKKIFCLFRPVRFNPAKPLCADESLHDDNVTVHAVIRIGTTSVLQSKRSILNPSRRYVVKLVETFLSARKTILQNFRCKEFGF